MDVEQALLLLTTLADRLNLIAGVNTSTPVTDLPCSAMLLTQEPSPERTTVLDAVVGVTRVATLDSSAVSQLSTLNAQLTAVPHQLDAAAITYVLGRMHAHALRLVTLRAGVQRCAGGCVAGDLSTCWCCHGRTCCSSQHCYYVQHRDCPAAAASQRYRWRCAIDVYIGCRRWHGTLPV